MVGHLVTMSRRHARVALKMTRCASAMGNRLVAGEPELAEARAIVAEFLEAKQWVPGAEVLVVEWLETSLSPSTQMWIPHPSLGPPSCDGVYEQLLEGPECVFLGSIPAAFDDEMQRRLEAASQEIALHYQALGYRGRCSFDFVCLDERICFVECNGRWGGTSTPMHLLDRVFSDRPAYRARDFVEPSLVGRPFAELAERVGDALYDARTGEGRFLLYNVGCMAVGKFDVIAIGDTIEEATEALEETLPALLAR